MSVSGSCYTLYKLTLSSANLNLVLVADNLQMEEKYLVDLENQKGHLHSPGHALLCQCQLRGSAVDSSCTLWVPMGFSLFVQVGVQALDLT